jgi:glycerol-1-phosphate dehydrogenase [NAD(P)+]
MKLNTIDLANSNITNFLNKEFQCHCGKKHYVNLEDVLIEKGAIYKLPEILKKYNYKKVFIASDQNTYEAAGKYVEDIIKNSGVIYKCLIYKRDGDLVPDERAVGEFFINIESGTDVIITVGTGVLNDLGKFMSCRLGIPSIVVATAPSMDGFASDGSALIINNLKTTLTSTPPKVIIGDIDVLKNSPMSMILAGIADMLGKYSALRDWKLGMIINDEYFCDAVLKLMEHSAQKCIEGIDGCIERNDDAIRNLMEGLVMSGVAMSFVGNSRPASGSEHHISHFWEMMFLLQGKKAVLHGTKVGISTLLINKIGEVLALETIDFEEAEKKVRLYDKKKWSEDIQTIFKEAADGILDQNRYSEDEIKAERLLRLKKIRENWDSIIKVISDMPSTAHIKELLERGKAPTSPIEIGIDEEDVKNAILFGKEVRERYTILQLLKDIGLLEEIANKIDIK